MRRWLPALIYVMCGWTGITRLFYALNRRRTLIVTYHNVIPDELFDDALHLGVSHRMSEFQRQLDLLAARFKLTTDIPSAEPGTCVVTFDDGYRNNLAAAAHLERLGARGVFFVPVEPVLSGQTLVIDQALRWFSYVPPGDYVVGTIPVTISEAGRQQAYSDFYGWALHNVGQWEALPQLLDDAFPFARLAPLPQRYQDLRFRPMDEAEIASLRKSDHRVGCHSYNHRPLAALTDDAMRADFEACQTRRDIFNCDVFSFPFGGPDEVDGRAIACCKAFGYRAAVANVADSDPDEIMALPRMSLPHSVNRHVLDARLSGLELFIKRFVS